MRRPLAALLAVGLFALVTVEGRDDQLKGWFDLPVRGGVHTLAALGIPLEERAFTLSIVARAIHGRESRIGLSSDRVTRIIAGMAVSTPGSTNRSELVHIPVPLDLETWRHLLGLKPADDLFARFLTDRSALLLGAGLMAADDSLRTLVTRDRDLLRFLYREAAASLVVTSRSVRLTEGRLVLPGGAGAETIWEALAESSVSRPASFLRALLTKDHGRLAWYFDTIAGFDEARLAVAWPMGPARARVEHATTLYESFRDADPQWRIADQPFRRSVADPWTVVMLSDIADGQLAGPVATALWELLFSSDIVERTDAPRRLRGDSSPFSMSSLVRATSVNTTVRERRTRFEMFRLAQRVFRDSGAAAFPDIAVALSGYRRYRSLLLALERMGVTDAETWALVVSAAHHVDQEADNERQALASFQAVVGLVERIRHVRSIDAATADRVLRALGEVVQRDRRVTPAIGRWITDSLVPALPRLQRPDAWTRRTAYESTILQALAGPLDRSTTIEWEGLTYKVDIVAAEHARLRAVRLQIPSPGLDGALESGKSRDLASALTALVYTTALGDAEGAAALSRDVATRHDFGLDSTTLMREVSPWASPEERQGMGAWRVHGSLIGLDLGLSRLTLRRVADQQMPSAPTLTLNDAATLTRTIVALVPTELTDADRDEIAAAIERGRRRVAETRTRVDALDALAREARVSAVARALLPWIASRQSDALAGLFSLRDLLWLGKPAMSSATLDRWGVAGDALDGRRGTVMPPAAAWENYAGRSDAGQIATQVPDVTLRLVEETARLKIPAILVPSLLTFAVEDYWHDVQVRFADDWPRMTHQAAAIQASRIEDYVAALAGNGPLRTQ